MFILGWKCPLADSLPLVTSHQRDRRMESMGVGLVRVSPITHFLFLARQKWGTSGSGLLIAAVFHTNASVLEVTQVVRVTPHSRFLLTEPGGRRRTTIILHFCAKSMHMDSVLLVIFLGPSIGRGYNRNASVLASPRTDFTSPRGESTRTSLPARKLCSLRNFTFLDLLRYIPSKPTGDWKGRQHGEIRLTN